ncbi:hypothetical protein R4172_19085 [Rhodococcus kroppenstedtii]|uniref:Unannotated protein n=1 Tax=freshwater metagenome TaxID=449393 RepID=A0A6J7F7D2_9ZZZZ|nr:hypothetical protein [Rhodococcus kroppenstedtii]MDV7199651.1 hypothetical protein [Rhodococcus kroppenstedtii]MSX06380.1 hypothetical protein [Actinomycetota bacterium]
MNTPAPSPLLSTAVLATCAAVSGAAHGALWAGHALAGTSEAVPGNPAEALVRISTGTLSWPPASTLLLMAATLLVVLGLLAGVHRQRRRSPEAAPTTTAATRWWADGPMIALGPPQSGKTALTPSAVLTSDKSVTIATRRGQAGTGGGDAA